MSAMKLDTVLLLLIKGISPEKVLQQSRQMGVSQEEAERLIGEARQRITLTADYARDEQLGTAIARLQDIYTTAINAKDIKTALQAQKELNKLFGLYAAGGGEGGTGGEGDAVRRLELIERYVLPLGLVGEEYPIEEHVRVAAEIARKAGAGVR